MRLGTTGDVNDPSWALLVECGAYALTGLNGAEVLPSGASDPKTFTFDPGVGPGSVVLGPDLTTPAGVRDDAFYFMALGSGNLCDSLDPPVMLAEIATGGIGGATGIASAALTLEGVGTPGFGLDVAYDGLGPIPLEDIRLVNGLPLPRATLALGPPEATAGGTRWEVCLTGTVEFHRIAFGLIAPAGTTTGGMRWLGCDTTPSPEGERTCNGVPPDLPINVKPARSWTVGPQAVPPQTEQAPHTLYVVLEGNRSSLTGVFGMPNTLNFQDEPACLGFVELDGNPGLEPAITHDGVDAIEDIFDRGKFVTPYEPVESGTMVEPVEVELIGEFDPADDIDGDMVSDLGDNCPFIANSQSNRGSFLDDTDESDFVGDACQCAESTDDGAVLDPDDFDDISDFLAGKITNPIDAAAIERRCSVAGTTECNIRDLVFLKQAIDAGATSVDLRCDAALSPPNGP